MDHWKRGSGLFLFFDESQEWLALILFVCGLFNSTVTERFYIAVMLQTYIWEVLSLNLSQSIGYPD
jgi:hypothetical protein